MAQGLVRQGDEVQKKQSVWVSGGQPKCLGKRCGGGNGGDDGKDGLAREQVGVKGTGRKVHVNFKYTHGAFLLSLACLFSRRCGDG